MKWGVDWGPGWSYYHCEECGNKFSEKSRDCTSPSGTSCPNCHGFTNPIGNEMHLEWPVDQSKNLIEGTEAVSRSKSEQRRRKVLREGK
jgi:NAD-dependent SIR2 family protein deacetylase